jgi:hypothetical protein
VSDVNDIAALEEAMDPDGSLRSAFDAVSLPDHEWVLTALLPIVPAKIRDIEEGRRWSFSFTLPSKDIRIGVFCERCQLTWDQMTDVERERCRG